MFSWIRYGDDAHLDTTVQALGLVLPNKEFPQLQYLRQVRSIFFIAIVVVILLVITCSGT